MNDRTHGRGLRERVPLAPQREEGFRWRGEHVTRVEGFTDAVFAFAVTLLVVSLEVPHDFEGLLDVVRAFPAFVICFTLLMTFWNSHHRFHRRYGLEDIGTRIYTMAVIVLTLFYVYPLKFLFTMVTAGLFGLQLRDPPHLETSAQLDTLYLIYGLGFAGVWGTYLLMYAHALRRRDELRLTTIEILYTRASIAENAVFVGVCLLSILFAFTTDNGSLPGYTFLLLGPLLTINGFFWGRKVRKLIAVAKDS
jgi:uncharacterized membrane protein